MTDFIKRVLFVVMFFFYTFVYWALEMMFYESVEVFVGKYPVLDLTYVAVSLLLYLALLHRLWIRFMTNKKTAPERKAV